MRDVFVMLRGLAASALMLAAAACAQTSTEAAPPTSEAAAPTATSDIGIDMPANFNDWLRGHYTERVLLFHTYPPMNGGVAFVGDSITEGGDWNGAYPDLTVRNYGIGGDTTTGLERRLKQVVAARPDKLFLLIGTNDLGNDHTPPAQILINYAIVLNRIAAELPDTRVYVQAVLPRQAEYADAVREINAGLMPLAASHNFTFVDIYTPFAVEGGRLDPAVTEDNLHLTAAGYARWRSVIDPLVRGQ
jgi:lysophospholipase L1-like esterase